MNLHDVDCLFPPADWYDHLWREAVVNGGTVMYTVNPATATMNAVITREDVFRAMERIRRNRTAL